MENENVGHTGKSSNRSETYNAGQGVMELRLDGCK